ncbi:MAG: MATE family efflux transporter [Acidaminobacteraceae bacterium]
MIRNDLTVGSISEHIKRIAIPASVGMFFNTMYNVVDTVFAGRLGTESLAGMSMSFPIFFIVIALSSGLATGSTALISNALGAKNSKKANEYAYNAVILSIIFGLIITVFGNSIGSGLFSLLGASGASLVEGMNYVSMIFMGSIFFIVNGVLNSLLSSQGDTKSYRNFLIVGFFLNCILDPLFIYGWFSLPKLGTSGVALATVVIQFLGMFYLLYKINKSEEFAVVKLIKSKISISKILEILRQAVPSSLNMITIALGFFVINYFVLKYGGDAAVAGYGASVRIEQIALLPTLGLNIATLTLVGQNFGARNYSRIKEIYKVALKYGLIIMTTAMIVIYPLSTFLVGLFNKDPEVVAVGSEYLRIEFLAFNTYVFLNVSISILQGLKKPMFAIYVGLYRQLAMPIVIFYALGTIFELGTRGVWWGIVLINWSAVLLIVAITIRNLKKLPEDGALWEGKAK